MTSTGQYFFRCCVAIAALAWLGEPVLAMQGGNKPAPQVGKKKPPPNIWYRYYNEKGVPTLSDQVTEEHVRRGYEVLDQSMQVTKRVAAFNNETYAKEKARREAELLQRQEDERIMKLYSSSYDAESARNRLLDTLETNIGYNRIQLVRLKRLRSELVEQAAESERSGKPLTAKQKAQITQYDSQISDLNSLIHSQDEEKTKVTNDFVPIIKRLGEIEKSKREGTYATGNGRE